MSQQDTRRGAGRDRIWMTVVMILLLLVVGLGALRLRVGHRLRSRTDELRAQGYPMSEADLNEHYAIPPEAENAADLYMRAFDAYVKANADEQHGLPKVGTAKLPGPTEPLPNGMKALAKGFLVKNEVALSCLYRAARIKHCQYPVKFSQDPQQLAPNPTAVRQAAFLLSLEASVHLDNGDPNRAVDSVEAALALSAKFPPSNLTNRLVQVAMQALALQSLERVLNQVSLTEQDLLSLSETICAFEASRGLRQTLIGERCYGLYCLDQNLGRMVFAKLVGVPQSQSTKYMNMMQAFIDITDQPEHQQIQLCKTIGRVAAQHGMFAQTLIPGFIRVFELESRCLAHCRVARTALALEAHNLAQGRLPEAVDGLVPAYLPSVPTDPFGGQALRYRKLDEGFVVYSVGEDLTDDGGEEPPKGEGRRDKYRDISITVKRLRQ